MKKLSLKIGAATGQRRVLNTYDRLHPLEVIYLKPRSESELVAILADAQAEGRHVCLRAGGNSIDAHTTGPDTVVAIDELPVRIEVDREARLLRCSGWATWRAVLSKCIDNDLIPYSMPTSGRITVGGSLSGDGLSRFSPVALKEYYRVHSLRLLAPGQSEPYTIHNPHCRHDWPADGPMRLPRGPRLPEGVTDKDAFYGVVGGFGLLGVITEVVIHLLDVAPLTKDKGPLRVATEVKAYKDWDRLFEHQWIYTRNAMVAMRERAVRDARDDPGHPCLAAHPAVPDASFESRYSTVFPVGTCEDEPGAMLTAAYTSGEDLDTFLLYQARCTELFQFTMRLLPAHTEMFNGMSWGYVAGVAASGDRCIDPVDDFTFFFERHTDATEGLERERGRPYPSIQQTFSIPIFTPGHRGQVSGMPAQFLREMRKVFGQDPEVYVQMTDALFLPESEVLLAPTRDGPSFAITIGAIGLQSGGYTEDLKARLKRLSSRCLQLGGKVHLTKNVYVDDDALAAMYGPELHAFLALKHRLDPFWTLRSTLFMELLAPAARRHCGQCSGTPS